MTRNILEEYIYRNKQIIIMILGMPCATKSTFAKMLSKDMKLKIINLNNYIKKDEYVVEKIENIKLKMYDHPKNYKWNEINDEINKLKTDGVIVYGNYIDKDAINFDIDFIFFMDVNNVQCKKMLIDEKKIPNISDDKINLYLTNYLTPLYDNLKKNIKINKFYNIKENTNYDEIYDNMWDYLMKNITDKLKNKKIE